MATRKSTAGRPAKQSGGKGTKKANDTVASVWKELVDAFEETSQGKQSGKPARTWAFQRYKGAIQLRVDQGSWPGWREKTLGCARKAGTHAAQHAGGNTTIRVTDIDYAAKKIEGEVRKLRERAVRLGVDVLGGIC